MMRCDQSCTCFPFATAMNIGRPLTHYCQRLHHQTPCRRYHFINLISAQSAVLATLTNRGRTVVNSSKSILLLCVAWMQQPSQTCPPRHRGCAKGFTTCQTALDAVHCHILKLSTDLHTLATPLLLSCRCWQGTSAHLMQATAGRRRAYCLELLQIARTPVCGSLAAPSGGR